MDEKVRRLKKAIDGGGGMSLNILDDTLNIDVFYEDFDSAFCDNVCIRFWESCPDEERIFIHEETNIFLTTDQARSLALLLLEAAHKSDEYCSGDHSE